MVLSAQMAKAGPPMHGKDLHVGDLASGILPAAAPLAIGSLTIAGMALAFARDGSGRVALSFIGEGGIVARRVARGDQPVRRAPAAGGLLRPEQPDGALDARARPVRGARVRRQGGGLRHSRASRSTAPIRTRSRRRSPGRSSARARGGARRSSSSSACACAATRTTTTCSISARIRSRAGSIRRSTRAGLRRIRELYAYWSARDPIPGLRGASAARRRHRRRASSTA